jgi:hypothetical protein
MRLRNSELISSLTVWSRPDSENAAAIARCIVVNGQQRYSLFDLINNKRAHKIGAAIESSNASCRLNSKRSGAPAREQSKPAQQGVRFVAYRM